MSKRKTPSATAPAKRTYRVLADCVQRFYQDIEAASPEEAYKLAANNHADWEIADVEPGSIYRTGDVLDIEADLCFEFHDDRDAMPSSRKQQ